VISNEHWGVTIIGSANLTNNTQADTGIITVDKEVAAYRIDWIIKNMNNGTK